MWKDLKLWYYINIIMSSKKECIVACNMIITALGNKISNENPFNIILRTYSSVIDEIVKTEPERLIKLFTIHVFGNEEYKKNILNGNDKFFIMESYDTDKINDIMIFKRCWNTMSDGAKKYIKQSFKKLIKLAENYLRYV